MIIRAASNSPGDLDSLKLTYHLKMDGWNSSFFLGWPIFRGHVSFRECNILTPLIMEVCFR